MSAKACRNAPCRSIIQASLILKAVFFGETFLIQRGAVAAGVGCAWVGWPPPDHSFVWGEGSVVGRSDKGGAKLWRNVQHESGVRSTGLALWSETR